jgi:hypothetical protein
LPERFLITTQSYRHQLDQEIPTEYGYLVETDFQGNKRLLKIPTPVASPYPDERLKPGLRGVVVYENKIYAATWNSIYIIDAGSFEIVDSVSHPLMADLHGLHVDERGIWVTSSLMDLVLRFDWEWHLTGVLQISTTEMYPEDIRRTVDLSEDYRLHGKRERGFQTFHCNHVTPYKDYNQQYMLVTGRGHAQHNGRILLVDRETMQHRFWIGFLRGPHDGIFLNWNTFVVTETNSSTLAFIHRWSPRRSFPFVGARVARRVEVPKDERGQFWTRGLCKTNDGSLLVGKSVWAGSDPSLNASVVRMKASGEVLAEYPLDFLGDYPECRIFQIVGSG